MKIGKRTANPPAEDVDLVQGLKDLLSGSEEDQDTKPPGHSSTVVSGAHATTGAENQAGTVAEDQGIVPVESPGIVVPQSQSTIVAEDSTATIPQDQGNAVVDDQDNIPPQNHTTPVSDDHSIVVPQSHGTTISSDPDTQSGKRPGWVQMTIWVRKDMEQELKLLSEFEQESISNMARTYFQQRLEGSPYRDLIRDIVRKRNKIKKKR